MRIVALFAIVALATSTVPAQAAEPSPIAPYPKTAAAAGTGAPRVSVSRTQTAVYPYRDGYADRISVDIATDEWARLTLEYVDRSGTIVKSTKRSGLIDERFWIDARTAGGAMWTSGTYVLRITAVDDEGNQRQTERKFVVSHKRLVQRTWRHTFTAAEVLTKGGVDVGACSSLLRPSRSGWRGSSGYYSMTSCRRADKSQVASVNGVWVPKALDGKYHYLEISMTGRGARSGGLRYGDKAYLNFGYYNAKGTFLARAQFNGKMGEHRGRRVKASTFIRDKNTSPYILFWAGLAGGSRYDVKSFTVRLSRNVLR